MSFYTARCVELSGEQVVLRRSQYQLALPYPSYNLCVAILFAFFILAKFSKVTYATIEGRLLIPTGAEQVIPWNVDRIHYEYQGSKGLSNSPEAFNNRYCSSV